MDKFVIKGVKKLLGLTKTKIRLAEEAETIYTKPRPLPLVKLLGNVGVETVNNAKEHKDKLASEVDYNDQNSVSSTVLQLMDIVEGVKHKFEPPEYCVLVKDKDLKNIEQEVSAGEEVNILLVSEECKEGVNLYIGYEPPKNAIHYGRVPTNLAHYMAYAFSSDILSKDLKLINTNIVPGHRTLILNVICFAIRQYSENQ